MKKLRLLDLFSGIGGFSLGLERSGYFETVAFCEIEDFPRRVLKKHWPEVPCYHDVRDLTAARLAADGIAVDAICGGFPCQDVSIAGKRAGVGSGTRSGLYSQVVRIAGEIRPAVIVLENVTGLLSGPSEQPGGWFGAVLGDLAALGYDAEWHCIPASAVGAHHRRDRIWVLAYAISIGQSQQGQSVLASRQAARLDREAIDALASGVGNIWRTESNVGRVANGVPDRMERLKALGNAVVPQIPELIGRAIGQAMEAQP